MTVLRAMQHPPRWKSDRTINALTPGLLPLLVFHKSQSDGTGCLEALQAAKIVKDSCDVSTEKQSAPAARQGAVTRAREVAGRYSKGFVGPAYYASLKS